LSNKEEVLEEVKEEIKQDVNQENNEINKDDYIAKLNDDLSEQRKKTDEYFEHLKRNMAEFDNFKKRMNKEKQSLYVSVTSDIMEPLLPILDNLEQSINVECSDEKFKDGILMIYNQLTESLKKHGLEEIECKTFDPNLHEAVMHEEDETKGEKEITQVFRKGYKINDKIIRHSMVKVVN
jgi:molecular chaperone GrpE